MKVRLQQALQALCLSKLHAMAEYGSMLRDNPPSAPWASTLGLARHIWNASRHVEILEKVMAYLVETTIEDISGQREYTEPIPGDVVQLVALARRVADPVVVRALDSILADDTAHEQTQHAGDV